ncbi:MAG: histidine phosphatase family protein [Steroidobacteraceae bacterium]
MHEDSQNPGRPLVHAQKRFRLPGDAREIVLVRHGSAGGEKVDNRLLFGELTLTDPPLWPEGEAQATAVCERLGRESIARIFITPLQRTRQTASRLLELTGIEPIVIPELREVHLGEFEHSFYARAAARDPLLQRMMAEESWEVLPLAEPMDEFSARVRVGIDKIVELLDAGARAIAFAHAGTIGEVCRQATGSRRFAFVAPENASITRLVVHGDGRWALRAFNDVSHLDCG